MCAAGMSVAQTQQSDQCRSSSCGVARTYRLCARVASMLPPSPLGPHQVRTLEPGTLSYELCISTDDPLKALVYERCGGPACGGVQADDLCSCRRCAYLEHNPVQPDMHDSALVGSHLLFR